MTRPEPKSQNLYVDQPGAASPDGTCSPGVHFYVPVSEMPPETVRAAPEMLWSWIRSLGRQFIIPQEWIVQTWLRLCADGLDCKLVHNVPDEGILLYHREFAPVGRQRPRLLTVCVLGDEERRDPLAHLHIVQNPRDTRWQDSGPFSGHHYIPFWPQPGLIARDPTRGNRFENVAYVGYERNLAPELRDPAWPRRVAALGLRWETRSIDRFHDYSDVDAVVAVRSFDAQPYLSKPANKLYNAWRAGIPAILSPESAYRAERRGHLDYMEVNSPGEVLSALSQLRDDLPLRRAIADNGRSRAREITDHQIVARWREFLTDVAIPAYVQWCAASPRSRQTFLLRRRLDSAVRSGRHAVRRTAKGVAVIVLPDAIIQTLKRVRSWAREGR